VDLSSVARKPITRMVTPDVSIARPQTAAMMSKYRYNRIVLTTLFLLMTASGLHLILFTSDLPRSAGVLLTTTGAAVPVWVFLGANRDMRRKQVAVLSGLETLQRSIRNLPTTATLADGQHPWLTSSLLSTTILAARAVRRLKNSRSLRQRSTRSSPAWTPLLPSWTPFQKV